jgi:uncharacterized protein
VIHPDSELSFISPTIGYGLIATRLIPKGTITWVGDPLDQIVSAVQMDALPELLRRHVRRYSWLNGRKDRILCWITGGS